MSAQSNKQQSIENQPFQVVTSQQQSSSCRPSQSSREPEVQQLTKLFHEIKYHQASSSPLPSASSSQNQRDFTEKVHQTLPIFLNVFATDPFSSEAPHQYQQAQRIHKRYSSHTSVGSIETDYNPRSESMVPLNKPPNSPNQARCPPIDRFPDIQPFAYTIARLFVSEVRRKASNRLAELASLEILKYLSPDVYRILSDADESQTTDVEIDESSHGWNLLSALNTLALSQNSQIIQLLCDASVPSTLIKCLYLFFDLRPLSEVKKCPVNTDYNPDNVHTQSESDSTGYIEEQNTPMSSYQDNLVIAPLIKSFTQLLTNLCSNQEAINELIKKDDLRLLFGLASTQCQIQNRAWRKTAFQTLLAISRNMSDNFVYLKENLCIQNYVENMYRVNSLGLIGSDEFVDMMNILVKFLYNTDVNNRNQPKNIAPLAEQFKKSRFLELVEELMFKIDDAIYELSQGEVDQDASSGIRSVSNQPSVSSELGDKVDELRRHGRKLIQTLATMAKINLSQETMLDIVTLKPLAISRYEMLEQFKMPKPSARNCISNYESLRLMKTFWSKVRDCHLIEAILETAISLFNDDKYNYFVFESQQLLVYFMTSNNFRAFSVRIKQKLFKFIEFVTIETNYIPCLELGTLGSLMRQDETSNSDSILILRSLIACLRFNSKFNDVFRTTGLLEIIIATLIRTMKEHDQFSDRGDHLEVLYLSLEASQCLLSGPNNLNCTQFNESGAARYVFTCLSNTKFFRLSVAQHGSSSDDSVDASHHSSVPHHRSHTPPLSALVRSSILPTPMHHQIHYRPAIKQIQKVAFTIIRQLILSCGDEHLANLLSLLARSVDDLKSMDESAEIDQQGETRSSLSDFDFLVSQEVNLKICVLKSLTIILKESHRCRTLFRKAGGFVHIVSALESLSESLQSSEQISNASADDHQESKNSRREMWAKVNSRRIWRLIKSCFMTNVVAMRSEPASIRVFTEEVMPKFVEAIRNLGCFDYSQRSLNFVNKVSDIVVEQGFSRYKSIFLAPPARDFSTLAVENMKSKDACCQLIRFLYDMSLDTGDSVIDLEAELERLTSHFLTELNSSNRIIRRSPSPNFHPQVESKSVSFDRGSNESDIFKRRSQLHSAPKRPPSLDLNYGHQNPPALLSFPNLILAIIDLIPSCQDSDLVIFISLVLKTLFRHEQNQQLLCEAGMVTKLMQPEFVVAITDKTHILYETFNFFLDKLTKQSITVRELTTFLRIGDPLRCRNLDDIQTISLHRDQDEDRSEQTNDCQVEITAKPDEKIATDRIEALVSMMNPSNQDMYDRFQSFDEQQVMQSPFIEFDMSLDGRALIFMPSIAPVNVKLLPLQTSSFLNSTLDAHTSEKNGILGGVGSQERCFPPSHGLTYSTWIYIDKFPGRSSDPNHNLRLLTIYRGSAATGREYNCFRLQISALDRAMTVSTQETLLFESESRVNEGQTNPDYNVRIWTPELILEHHWHHIAVSLHPSTMKQQNLHVYVDGVLAHSQRIFYISNLVGPTNSGPLGHPSSGAANSQAAFVNAFIGALPQFKCHSRARWRQGSCHLVEEALSPNYIAVIFALGPTFIGNFQSSTRLNELARERLSELALSNPKYQKLDLFKALKHHQTISSTDSASSRGALDQRLSRVSSAGGQHRSSPSSSQSVYHSISEDRILIAIDARAASQITPSRMRKICTRFDCRQISRVLSLSLQENSTPILLLHNSALHLTGPGRSIGAVTVGPNHVRIFVPSPVHRTLFSVGGCYVLLAFVAQSKCTKSFEVSIRALICAIKQDRIIRAQMDDINGYQILSVFLRLKKKLISDDILKMLFYLVIFSRITRQHRSVVIQQVGAMRDLICESFDLWVDIGKINLVLEFIHDLINSGSSVNTKMINEISGHTEEYHSSSLSSSTRNKNLKYLRDLDLLPRILRLLPQDDTGDLRVGPSIDHTKSIYLIKQIVFELLNKTPRQPDLLYFGQFLASLLPCQAQERPDSTIELRNILLKSLLQMMTKNKQREVNNAMQEQLVRILGFDWFMLFISGAYLNNETLAIGFLNLMVVLSNGELYAIFKSKQNDISTNGGWLKEPTFPTIDGKFNIQLLGINVGVFLGLKGKRKSVRQDVIGASNLFLLICCLRDLVHLPNVYIMLFMLMIDRFKDIDSNVLDIIGAFETLSFDSLCDCLVGDSHHKRRQTSAALSFKCHEMVVCLIYMIRDIMCDVRPIIVQPGGSTFDRVNGCSDYPVGIVKFIMYLYNNNRDFQLYCRHNDEFINSLSEALMMDSPESKFEDSDDIDWTKRATAALKPTTSGEKYIRMRPKTSHPATSEILELSRLVILDSMTETNGSCLSSNIDRLHAFMTFFDALEACKEARSELVDMLMVHILLMIDSKTRNNSSHTMISSDSLGELQLLLTNSVTIAQILTDKIWHLELFQDEMDRVSMMMGHYLCLTEQVFKFHEILPKHSPSYAFMMQETLNRLILFSLSRPTQQMSDRMLVLDLLKRIHDNRSLIILNHMHSDSSAEFFICLTHLLMKVIEENSLEPIDIQADSQQPSSLIERQYGHRQPGSSGLMRQDSASSLMLVSMAKKVWDSVYQSKKNLLSEVLDVSLSLPAFTLETSLDLMQLKPDIHDSCMRSWNYYSEREQKQRPCRFHSRQNETTSTTPTATSSGINLLSGRLTKVVNAASFVSRVVGATAGSMASNVNLVGEKFSQTTRARKESSTSQASTSGQHSSAGSSNQQGSGNLTDSPGQLSRQISQSDRPGRFTHPSLSKFDVNHAYQVHISIIIDHVHTQSTNKTQNYALHRYVCDEWLDTEREILLRERAVFGPMQGSVLDKWSLDMTEGPRRMRKKMFKSTDRFFDNYPYRPENYSPDNKSLRYRPPMSYHSRDYYLKTLNINQHFLDFDELKALEVSQKTTSFNGNSTSINDEEQIKDATDGLKLESPDQRSFDGEHSINTVSPSIHIDSPEFFVPNPSPSEDADKVDIASDMDMARRTTNPISRTSSHLSDQGDRDGDSTSFVDFSPEIEAESNFARESENFDSLSVLRLLERDERISHMFRCSRVQGLDTYEGLMLFGREHFYLIDGFTLLKTREIKDIDSLPPDSHDPIIPNSTPNLLAHSKKMCSKFSFETVIEVHKRRYLLQPIALEVFSSDGRNTLVVFPRNIRNKVYSRLMTVATKLNSNTHESLAGQKSNVNVEGGSGLLSNLIGETSVTQRWVRGELSNFQYLMNLNTIAGRSYNDLMQYPIFPWILADYTSDYLDLTKPTSFRDLSRPVGAQTKERLDQFKRRFAEWDDSETPPYHYGTFYSSAMIVASYMVRMEPFTQHFLRLQGGHFDLADRMFHSISDSWMSASKHNMADIKELIPEFFYLPEFLKNENRYDLGIKQNGMKLDDVILPPWAKGDAREFIRLHRSALESDYVSAHLHEWIDLIFGCKQQGQAAIDAVNVFHHLFYEGNVDIYNTEIDPIKKNAVIGFINNFGQVPKQLFKKPHPAKKQTSSSTVNLSLSGTPSPILPSLSVATHSNLNQATQRNITHFPQALRLGIPPNSLKDLKGPVGQIVQIDKSLVAVEQNKLLIPPEYCRYIAWGHADRSLRLGLYENEKPIFVWEGSQGQAPSDIMCCTIPNSQTMITAGTDSIITVWKIDRVKSFSPIMNLHGHVEPITCLASSQAYSVIISGSRDRTAIIWDLNKFNLTRQLGNGKIMHQGPVSAIAINDSTGDIATCALSWLYLWTINGDLLAQVDSLKATLERPTFSFPSVPSSLGQLQLLSVCFSQFHEWSINEVIVTGASDGSVSIWSMRYIQEPLDPEGESNEQHVDREGDEKPGKNEDDDGEEENLSRQRNQNEAALEGDKQQAIQRRRTRTDTINSDWVKLSNSSASTIDAVESQNSTCAGNHKDSKVECVSSIDSQSNFSANLSTRAASEDNNAIVSPMPEITTAEESAGAPTNADISFDQSCDQSTISSKLNLLIDHEDASLMKFSKSETSLIDSFVILGDSSPNSSKDKSVEDPSNQRENEPRPQSSIEGSRVDRAKKRAHGRDSLNIKFPNGGVHECRLLPNHHWKRQLYLRAVLTRLGLKSNWPLAPVTSLTISKDHRTLFVGDASGKVFTWLA